MNKRGYFFCKGDYANRWVNFSKRGWVNLAQRYRALAHKLARASYYIMKDGVGFDSNKLFS
jgi:hypothetical protein